jgi:hypothetical protein
MVLHRLMLLCAAALCGAAPASAAPDWSKVDAAFGRQGTVQPDAVHRYSFPRSDLRVTLEGIVLKPALALGSWIAFEPMGDEVVMMGDLVLQQGEVNRVMSKLLDMGIMVTALHNHLLRSSPGTVYMHVHGRGDPVRLAAAVRSALALSGTPLGPPKPPPPPPPLALDTAALDRVLGAEGKANGGVYQVNIPRPERIMDAGMPVPPTMGLAIALNFQPTTGGRVVATGDYVLLASEVDPVMRALRGSGIEVTALHNHLGQEEPRLFFMHFWGNGPALDVARGLRKGLDATAVKLK